MQHHNHHFDDTSPGNGGGIAVPGPGPLSPPDPPSQFPIGIMGLFGAFPTISIIVGLIMGAGILHNRFVSLEAAVQGIRNDIANERIDIQSTYVRKDNQERDNQHLEDKVNELLRAIDRLQADINAERARRGAQ